MRAGETRLDTLCPVCKQQTAAVTIFGRGFDKSAATTAAADYKACVRSPSRLKDGRRWLLGATHAVYTRLDHPSLLLLLGMAIFAYTLKL